MKFTVKERNQARLYLTGCTLNGIMSCAARFQEMAAHYGARGIDGATGIAEQAVGFADKTLAKLEEEPTKNEPKPSQPVEPPAAEPVQVRVPKRANRRRK